MATEETITATEANRSFSRVLRGVQEGRCYIITSHGTPVARVLPPVDDIDIERRAEARLRLLERLERQPVMNAGRWTREELYEDED
jgi:prevent-host-death family protein